MSILGEISERLLIAKSVNNWFQNLNLYNFICFPYGSYVLRLD